MLIQTESKAQGWRAVAVFENGAECLVFVGRSSTHVRQEYVESYLEALEEDERDQVAEVQLQQWSGAPDAGRWVHKSNLKVPTPTPVKLKLVA